MRFWPIFGAFTVKMTHLIWLNFFLAHTEHVTWYLVSCLGISSGYLNFNILNFIKNFKKSPFWPFFTIFHYFARFSIKLRVLDLKYPLDMPRQKTRYHVTCSVCARKKLSQIKWVLFTVKGPKIGQNHKIANLCF